MRDLIRGVEPKDWDITTSAKPEEIQKIFPDSFYNNDFGTVGLKTTEDVVEVTPFRSESGYSDKRHPDQITFGVSLQEDLARRDFTMNAMAFDGEKIIDPFDGKKDLSKKVIRAVGEPKERLREDALRLMRACRLAAELFFTIEHKNYAAIKQEAAGIKNISQERIRDELIKIMESDYPIYGIWLLRESGLLQHIMPELEEGVDMSQNLHHIYSVFFHNLLSLQYCPSDDYRVRLAALLHDIGKSRTKQGEGRNATFHGHEIVGAKMAQSLLKRLKFSKEDQEKITHLVRQHMFYYAIDEITDAGVRRIIKRIGPGSIKDILAVRVADRMGSGCQIEIPFKLKELQKRMEKVSQDPITTSMLAIDGRDLMKELGLEPGPRLGFLLNSLLEEVIDDPQKNNKEYLVTQARELHARAGEGDDMKLKRGQDRKLKKKLDDIDEEEEERLNKKYFN